MAIMLRLNLRAICILLLLFVGGASLPNPTRAEDRTPSPGTIVALFGRDPTFCESFIYSRNAVTPPSGASLLDDRDGFGDLLIPTQRGKPLWHVARRDGDVYQVDFDSDGKTDQVLWVHGESHYFSGDYFVILPSDADLSAKIRANADDDADVDIEEALAWAKSEGVSVYGGGDTPYRSIRYTRFFPVVIGGETLVWAYPVNSALKPAALLYRPSPGGVLERICEYQRVE
jgi:hypothetical protein